MTTIHKYVALDSWAARARAWLAGTDDFAHHAACGSYPLVGKTSVQVAAACTCGLIALLAEVSDAE